MAQATPPTRMAARSAQSTHETDMRGSTTSGEGRVADFLHGPLVQTVVMADRKAGILFTLMSAVLLFLFTRVPASVQGLEGGVWVVTVAALLIAAGCAFSVVFPRLRKRPGDIFFWGGIAEFPDAATYRAAVRTTDDAELEAAKLRYCYDLACICRRKFKFLRLAMIAAVAGLGLFLLYLAITATSNSGRLPPIT